MITTKTTLTIATILLLSLSMIQIASAEFWQCYDTNEIINYCNPKTPDRTCSSSTGCLYCMNNYDAELDCYNQGNFNVCNTITPNCEAGSGGGSPNIDSTPPNITFSSPLQDVVYSERSIPLSFTLNEKADVTFRDNFDNRGERWLRVCNDCTSHNRDRSFTEGLNDITFRIIDVVGNTKYHNVSFWIDSKPPRIKTVEPNDEFASGIFSIEFDEGSPESLELTYGNEAEGERTHTVIMGSACTPGSRGNTHCTTQVNLSDYEDQLISYYFTLTDKAGSTATHDPILLSVDNTPPEILSLDFIVDGRYATITVRVQDENLDEIEYYDNGSRTPRWKRLCSRIVNGVCTRRVSFSDGPHIVDVRASDSAGNNAMETIEFYTDSRKPRIKSTNPRRGFSDGNFEVTFTENNPTSIILTYGNATELNEQVIPIETCTLDRNYKCSATVNLAPYDGQLIQYWFTVTDIIGQTHSSNPIALRVDITAPVLNSINHSINGRRVTIVSNITELNFDEITYTDLSSSRPRARRLCSRLTIDGICEKRITLRTGPHNLQLNVIDEAGNSITEFLDLTIGA